MTNNSLALDFIRFISFVNGLSTCRVFFFFFFCSFLCGPNNIFLVLLCEQYRLKIANGTKKNKIHFRFERNQTLHRSVLRNAHKCKRPQVMPYSRTHHVFSFVLFIIRATHVESTSKHILFEIFKCTFCLTFAGKSPGQTERMRIATSGDEWRRASTAFNHKHNCFDYVRVSFPFLSIVLLRRCFSCCCCYCRCLYHNSIRSFVNIHYHCDCGQTMSRRSKIRIYCARSDDATPGP